MSPIKLPTPTTVNMMQQLGMINTYQDKWLNANVIVELTRANSDYCDDKVEFYLQSFSFDSIIY